MDIKSFKSSFSWKWTFKHYVFRSLFLKFKFHIIDSYFFILIPFTIWKYFKRNFIFIFIIFSSIIIDIFIICNISRFLGLAQLLSNLEIARAFIFLKTFRDYIFLISCLRFFINEFYLSGILILNKFVIWIIDMTICY